MSTAGFSCTNNSTPPKTVVTGIGCLSALGTSYQQCLENLFLGEQNCVPPTRFSSDHPEVFPVFEVADIDVPWPKNTATKGRTAKLAMTATFEALNDAGYSIDFLKSKRVGVCIGTTVGNSMNNEEFYKKFLDGEHPELTEMERYFNSNPAEVIANELELAGPVLTVANACSSGTDAIGIGRSWLEANLCDIVIAGGSDELSHVSYLGFISLMISSTSPCTPFDKNREGLNLGEGAAILIIEKNTPNIKRKAVIASYTTACDAYHLTAPHPEGRGLRVALQNSLKEAGLDTVGCINAHGTGTLENDKVEMNTLKELFPETPYFSIKGCTGHTLGAAGAIEAAMSIGCLERAEVPASIGFTELPEDQTSPPVVKTMPLSSKSILSQSLAFGGNNSVIIIQS